jgi:hypothetical protein
MLIIFLIICDEESNLLCNCLSNCNMYVDTFFIFLLKFQLCII